MRAARDLAGHVFAQLPGDRGSITFERIDRYAGLSVRHDPGQGVTLVAALLALAGLVVTLTMKRRRVFVRLTDRGDGTTALEVAGMSRDDDDRLAEIVAEVRDDIEARRGAVGGSGA